MTKSSVPIKVWIKSLVLFILIFWGAYTVLYFRIINGEIRKYYLLTKNYSKGERLDLYFLGSSLTERALVTQRTLESAFAIKKPELSYKVAYHPAAIISDFDDRIQELKTKRPKYLFIESNIICINKKKYTKGHQSLFSFSSPKEPTQQNISQKFTFESKFMVQISGFLQNYSSRLLRQSSKLIESITSKIKLAASNSLPPRKETAQFSWDNYPDQIKYYRSRTIHDFPEWNEFFKETKKLGIQVYFLELPRSKKAKTYFSEEFYENEKKLIEQYANKYGIKSISFPFNLDQEEYYYDAAHFNESGAHFYCNWLTDVITEISSK